MKILLELKNLENIGYVSDTDKAHFAEIFEALIVSGGLTGVKGGSTNIHFDSQGLFKGINLNYWPYRKRT